MVYRISLLLILFLVDCFANINFEKLESFKAKFIQTITNQSDKKIVYKGEIFIKKEGKVLWKYEEPIRKDVYMIGQKVIIDEPELEQVIVTTLEKNIDIVTLLKEAKKIDKNLYSTKLYDTQYFIEIENDKVQKIYFKDELSNNIDIKFLDVQNNVPLDDKLFMFFIPENYDIIEK